MGKKKKHAAVMVEPPKGDVQEVIGSVELIKGSFANERVLAEIADASRNLYDQSRFGEPYENKIQYSLVEALYLVEKKKLEVYDSKNKAGV